MWFQKAILAQGSNSNRKKLQLQFSIQKDDSDSEDLGECVFFDNPATATLLSEADEDEVITRVVKLANVMHPRAWVVLSDRGRVAEAAEAKDKVNEVRH